MTIDHDATYSLRSAIAATSVPYSGIATALQRGDLPSTRNRNWGYEIRGSDLLAWMETYQPFQPQAPQAHHLSAHHRRLRDLIPPLSDEQASELVVQAEGLL